MLEMGLVAARRLYEIRSVGASSWPRHHHAYWCMEHSACDRRTSCLSLGGSTLLVVLSASASYHRGAGRHADSLLKRTLAVPDGIIGSTFPFNLALGIPIYLWFARLLWGD